MTKKRYLTKKLRKTIKSNYLQLQESLVEIFEVMVHEKLYGDEKYYQEKLEKLIEFLSNEIYR